MTLIRIEDCRALKYCTSGVRRYFRQHGLDFDALLGDGFPAEQLPQDDPMAQRVIETARKRESEQECAR